MRREKGVSVGSNFKALVDYYGYIITIATSMYTKQ